MYCSLHHRLSRRDWAEIGVAYCATVIGCTVTLYCSWSWPHLPGTMRLFPDAGITMLAVGTIVALGVFACVTYPAINRRFMTVQALLTAGGVGVSQNFWSNILTSIIHPTSSAGGAWVLFISYEISLIAAAFTVLIILSLLVIFVRPIREALHSR